MSSKPPTNPHPNPLPHPVTETPKRPIVNATRDMARPKKSGLNSTAAPELTAGKSKKKAAASIKTAAAKTTPPNLVVPTQHSTFQLPPSSPSMRGADSSVYHVHLLPPHRSSSPAGCPEDRYPVRGRIWHYAIWGRNVLKPCAPPAGMRTEYAAGNFNWSIFSARTVSKVSRK